MRLLRNLSIVQDIQSTADKAINSHDGMKWKLADITNQLDITGQTHKCCLRNNCAAEADNKVKNPASIEERDRSSGRHFVIEYGLFPVINIHALLETEEDPTFKEDREFDSEDNCVQGQLRDTEGWIADLFGDGISGQCWTINTRLHHERLIHIICNFKFQDGSEVNIKDFDSSALCFNAFAKYIGYQEVTQDVDGFYLPMTSGTLIEDNWPHHLASMDETDHQEAIQVLTEVFEAADFVPDCMLEDEMGIYYYGQLGRFQKVWIASVSEAYWHESCKLLELLALKNKDKTALSDSGGLMAAQTPKGLTTVICDRGLMVYHHEMKTCPFINCSTQAMQSFWTL
ncbi:hypothetical protein C8R45DRAFT_942504 [Mycena sanguinolenta]|nr:hypothetical protein C8R45DRAFT_942504 [Mycena sanguinolenta]